jgi:hypothetical protein
VQLLQPGAAWCHPQQQQHVVLPPGQNVVAIPYYNIGFNVGPNGRAMPGDPIGFSIGPDGRPLAECSPGAFR